PTPELFTLSLHDALPILLLPVLKQSDDPRIINVSSDSHFHGKIHFDDVNLTNNYHGLRAYAQSKLANVLFTFEFERRKTFPISIDRKSTRLNSSHVKISY